MVTERLKQQRVPVRWVLPLHTELQAPLKHLRKEQTPEMLPSVLWFVSWELHLYSCASCFSKSKIQNRQTSHDL